ncbi:cytochrome c oxidase VIIc family protein [Paenibacillus sp. N3.4]|uniref:cytochrome c oxidase VIIc family protein n=1 Tax=Paenibacillus sp. N3.4 TaxID=2603222 RepID=UPI0011C8EA7B|nr:cytochrome c oxidase VIIc family protein [Paenibacillus sp. N3.4]TXK86110.1 hypothetical protein FU659_01350 [Paenibacillus sp. N3.4]
MSNAVLYWVFLGVAFAVPFLIGVWMMRKTNRLAFSFWTTTALNIVMTLAAALWWKSVSQTPFQMMFGMAFYGISCVNLMVIEFFALFSMRKKLNS